MYLFRTVKTFHKGSYLGTRVATHTELRRPCWTLERFHVDDVMQVDKFCDNRVEKATDLPHSHTRKMNPAVAESLYFFWTTWPWFEFACVVTHTTHSQHPLLRTPLSFESQEVTRLTRKMKECDICYSEYGENDMEIPKVSIHVRRLLIKVLNRPFYLDRLRHERWHDMAMLLQVLEKTCSVVQWKGLLYSLQV